MCTYIWYIPTLALEIQLFSKKENTMTKFIMLEGKCNRVFYHTVLKIKNIKAFLIFLILKKNSKHEGQLQTKYLQE